MIRRGNVIICTSAFRFGGEGKETLSRFESLEEGLTSSPRAGHHAVVDAVQFESIPASKPSRLKAVRSDISGLLKKRKETWSHAESLVVGSTSCSRAGFNASIQAEQPGNISASKPAKLNATSFNVSGFARGKERIMEQRFTCS